MKPCLSLVGGLLLVYWPTLLLLVLTVGLVCTALVTNWCRHALEYKETGHEETSTQATVSIHSR